jgi:predicted nucleic acid-binding Zn ribbon protein
MVRRFDGRDDEDDELRDRLRNWEGPTELGEALEQFLGHLGTPPVSVIGRLGETWAELVGPELATVSRPVSLVDGVLTVACGEAAWAARLRWAEAQIRRRAEQILGPETVRSVSVRVDR